MVFKFILLIFFSFSLLFSQLPVHSLNRPYSDKANGLGGAFTALADDEALLFYNPAGLGVKQKNLKQKSQEYNNVFDPRNILFLEFFKGSALQLSDYINTLAALLSGGNLIGNLENLRNQDIGPNPLSLSLNFSYINKPNNTFAWGISSFNSLNFNRIRIGRLQLLDLITPEVEERGTLDFRISLDSQFALGFVPFSLSTITPYDFHIGFNVRGFYLYDLQLDISTIEQFISFARGLRGATGTAEFSALPAINDYLLEGFGVALDLGILWEIILPDKENQINLAFTVYDAPGVIFPLVSSNEERQPQSFFLPNIGVGAAWKIPYTLDNFFNNTAIALDYLRILDPNLDELSKLHFGITTDIYNYKSKVVFSAGVGMQYFRPSFSTSLYIYYFKVNYTFKPFQFGRVYGQEVEYLSELSFSMYL